MSCSPVKKTETFCFTLNRTRVQGRYRELTDRNYLCQFPSPGRWSGGRPTRKHAKLHDKVACRQLDKPAPLPWAGKWMVEDGDMPKATVYAGIGSRWGWHDMSDSYRGIFIDKKTNTWSDACHFVSRYLSFICLMMMASKYCFQSFVDDRYVFCEKTSRVGRNDFVTPS